jgi:hypothetical protein
MDQSDPTTGTTLGIVCPPSLDFARRGADLVFCRGAPRRAIRRLKTRTIRPFSYYLRDVCRQRWGNLRLHYRRRP